MVASQRSSGRPVSAERFGREKIVSGFRALVREGRGQIMRKDIAEYLGITPALVTYYFPVSSSLFKEAFNGIFDPWLVNIEKVDQGSPKEIIDVIVSFFRVELHTEELFRSMIKDGIITDNTLARMERRTAAKIAQLTAATEDESVSIADIIWGSARQFAFSGLEKPPTVLLGIMVNAVAPPRRSLEASIANQPPSPR